jgi:hypothetical protein
LRPAGQISQALLTAAMDLVRDEGGQRRGPTLQEMAHHACVGIQAARCTVSNLRRHGKIEPVFERQVEYRNRPVLEYAPTQPKEAEEDAFFDVASVFTAWARG